MWWWNDTYLAFMPFFAVVLIVLAFADRWIEARKTKEIAWVYRWQSQLDTTISDQFINKADYPVDLANELYRLGYRTYEAYVQTMRKKAYETN